MKYLCRKKQRWEIKEKKKKLFWRGPGSLKTHPPRPSCGNRLKGYTLVEAEIEVLSLATYIVIHWWIINYHKNWWLKTTIHIYYLITQFLRDRNLGAALLVSLDLGLICSFRWLERQSPEGWLELEDLFPRGSVTRWYTGTGRWWQVSLPLHKDLSSGLLVPLDTADGFS